MNLRSARDLDATRPRPRAAARRDYDRTRGRGGAWRCGPLQPVAGPPRGAGQPAGRPLSRVGRRAAALPGRGAGGRRHDGRRRPAGRAPPRQRRHARRLDRERRLRPHCALAPGGGFRPAGLWLQRTAPRSVMDPGSAGEIASPGLSPTWRRAPGRRRPFLGNVGRARVGAPGPAGGSWSRPGLRLLLP